MESTSLSLASTRVCQGCLQPRPLSEFRLETRQPAKRSARCRICHNQAERIRRARLRGRLTRKDMAGLLSKLRAESGNARVVALCDQMTRRFGGVNGFVRAWEACLARDLQKGGNAAFRHLAAVIRLAQYCEQTKPSPQSMTEEELELAIQSLGGEVPIG